MVAKKLGDGGFDGEGVALFDVVATLSGTTIAASAFDGETDATSPRFTQYLARVAQALQSDSVEHVYVAFDASAEKAKQLQEGVSKTLSTFKGDLTAKVTLLCAEEAEIEKRIAEIGAA